jgi:hypothetical protein
VKEKLYKYINTSVRSSKEMVYDSAACAIRNVIYSSPVLKNPNRKPWPAVLRVLTPLYIICIWQQPGPGNHSIIISLPLWTGTVKRRKQMTSFEVIADVTSKLDFPPIMMHSLVCTNVIKGLTCRERLLGAESGHSGWCGLRQDFSWYAVSTPDCNRTRSIKVH